MRTLLMLKDLKQRLVSEPEARHAPSDWDADKGCRTITVWDFAFEMRAQNPGLPTNPERDRKVYSWAPDGYEEAKIKWRASGLFPLQGEAQDAEIIVPRPQVFGRE